MIRVLAALIAGALVGAAPAQQIPAGAAPAQQIPADVARALQPYDEFRAHALASWHPAKREVLVMRNVGGADTAHRVAEPGATPQPLPASAGASQADYPRVRGEHFVFIAPGADGVPRIQRYDVSTQSAAIVSPAGERATAFAWNGAGDRIVYATSTVDSRGARTTLRIVDPVRPATERPLARLEGTWTDLRFSPNGRRIAATQVVSARESHLWQIGVATGTRRRVTRPDGKGPVAYRSPQFSSDGNGLFALSDRGSDFRRLVLIPLAGGPERVLTTQRFDVDAFEVSADAGLLAFLTNENGAHVMRFIDLVTLKEQPRPALIDGVIGGLAWRPGSHEIGFHLASARTAGDVFSYDAKSNQVTRWTNGNNPNVNTRELPEPRVIRWKSADGREVTGLHYRPPPRFAGKRPVIVDHRTAPGSQARAGFLGRTNYMVGELGIAIIRPNVRGASGFGKDYLAAGAGLRRDEARKDIAALLEWIAAQPDLDASRTLVVGDGTDKELGEDGFMHAAIDFARRVQP